MSKTITVEHNGAQIILSHEQIIENWLSQSAVQAPMININKGIPLIGEHWEEEGGVYAGDMRGRGSSPQYSLIVPTDPAAYTKAITWGSQIINELGSVSHWDGRQNTDSLCASRHRNPAAQWAAGLTADGYRDLYLPARHELRLCGINAPELFKDGWYWTSTQHGTSVAWAQHVVVDIQNYSVKCYEFAARAVRRVYR